MNTLCVISINWMNQNRYASKSDCVSLGSAIDKFYTRNSLGSCTFRPSSFVERVLLNANKSNLNRAVQIVKSRHPGFDYYVIVNNIMAGSGNADGNVANVGKALDSLGCHEMGHLLGLRHAGAYTRFGFKDKGDGQSVMGASPSPFLTAPQYHFKRWVHPDDCVLYEGPGPKTFLLRRLWDRDDHTHPSLIRIPFDQRDAFISVTSDVCLHLGAKGGSQRVAIFKHKCEDQRFTKLRIVKDSVVDGRYTMITVGFIM